MGDKKTLAMARKELEDMYVGVPDDSVNLSFQDLAHVIADKKKLSPSPTMSMSMPPISESGLSPADLARLPSLDFNRAIQQASSNNHQFHTPHHLHHHQQQHHHHNTINHGAGFRASPAMDQRSFMSDDMSQVSGMSFAAYGGGGGRRRRPGIPHSNICTVCSTYIYIFRNRCLVCGRVYCRRCVAIGMGEMAEGRKCKEHCLGKRFSQKYISKAGNVGCCLGYPSSVKQQELKWAEKGPRTHHTMVAPPTPRPPPIPTSHHSNPPSFIASSPYSHNNHHQFAPL